MGKFRDLLAYKKAFALAMEILYLTKKFPQEELYSLTAQIRKSSRSVCSCIGESYKKRQYPNHFVSKLSDAGMENSETQVWLDFSLACGYISQETFNSLDEQCEEVARLVQHMIQHPEKFS